jgi:hypothetical protein
MKALATVIGMAAFLAATQMMGAQAMAAVAPGETAPDFTLTDSNGQSVSLSDYDGKQVVLEWTNHDCPFVRKHYSSGNMQATQKAITDEGVVWLSVISSAPGKQGYVDGAEANALTKSRDAHPTRVLLDPKGEVGRLYGATATPQLVVMDAAHKVQYYGAIDDTPTANINDLKTAHNLVLAAFKDMDAGNPVAVPYEPPYGCTVKY